MLERPAAVLLLIGTVVPIMAVQRVTFGLVAIAAASWSFVVAVQMLVGAALIVSAPARSVSMASALDLWFTGHVPFSLWLLLAAVGVGGLNVPAVAFLLFTAIPAAVWPAYIVCGFCRTVLGTTAPGARRRAAAHQAIVWTLALAYVFWSAGGFAAVGSSVARRIGLLS